MANEDLTPKDVDREYVVAFMITDEKASFLLRQNLALAFPSMPTLQYSSLIGSYPSFADSESFHHINGDFLISEHHSYSLQIDPILSQHHQQNQQVLPQILTPRGLSL